MLFVIQSATYKVSKDFFLNIIISLLPGNCSSRLKCSNIYVPLWSDKLSLTYVTCLILKKNGNESRGCIYNKTRRKKKCQPQINFN